MKANRCVYCGWPTRHQQPACLAHDDLPAIDPYNKQQHLRKWWRDRYTPEEIVELAAGLEPLRKAA